jgi:hypothetical protein
MSGPLALGRAAASAYGEAHELARIRPDPGMPLPGYLQPLQDLTYAVACASGTAGRLADMAGIAIDDPEAAASARKALRDAAVLAGHAADHLDTAYDEVRRIIRLTGRGLPRPDGTPSIRRFRTTAAALQHLSDESGTARAAHPPLALDFLQDPASHLIVILARLGQASEKLRAGIDHALTSPPRLPPRKASRATSPVAYAGNRLMKSSGTANQGARIISDELTRQHQERRQAAP